uniref:hypothetical protein n=1 Tax=Stieleria sp. TaxID=2795976 RepID=UPI0035630271
FGLGEGLIADEIGVVTHNSFLHCYAELGFFGGTTFVACFLAAGSGLWSQRRPRSKAFGEETPAAQATREHSRLCGYLFAALMGCIAAMLTISRQFVAPTYLILGLVAAAISMPAIASIPGQATGLRIGNRFVLLSLLASAASLCLFYMTIRLFVRW